MFPVEILGKVMGAVSEQALEGKLGQGNGSEVEKLIRKPDWSLSVVISISTVYGKMWCGLCNFSVNIITPKKYFTNANSALFHIGNYWHFYFDY